MVNIVNEKIRRDSLCEIIDEVAYSYYDKNKKCANIIDDDKKLKLITGYSIVLFNYASEISYLIKGDKFTTIHSLTRDFLECYAIIIESIKLYDKENENIRFQKELIINGLNQEIKTIKELKINGYNAYSNNIKYVKSRLNNYFLEERVKNKILTKDVIEKMEFKELGRVVYELYNRYAAKKSANNFIARQLKQNSFLEEFKTNNAIYRELCNYTHMNRAAIENMILLEDENVSVITNFKPSDNIPFLLTLIYSCLKDVFQKINKIINE
ncbi:hypothetical protein FDF29_06645 [Clostridium botulinum]|uniref:Membrane protein n=1 Tax=Clostridium botulinum (strain Hall / ATCC 3502 / NCTC 13319 / Type A) TaxID=441771 RepID=A5I494_CLOBH|nr:hypothetical protein [Clostridium botulinum]NFL68491.1 hypothetical protein [Clostridium botulinum]NFQ52957.1 hypothetical protein [Clostridium botulinum]NFT45929.1 hypothetical protein [Clostridium botulinum]QGT41867.1 hypothetical protein GJ703_00044 [Clostridium botulinum]CAL83866.1 putative membrane protein [Clostridium botulinum A str. ATCC 3502]